MKSFDQSEDFETQLRQQPVREIPNEWRAEVLAAARAAAESAGDSKASPSPGILRGYFSTLYEQISALFWPSPKAWSALAVVWIGLLVLNYATAHKPEMPPLALRHPGQEILMARQEQQKLLAELLGQSPQPSVIDRPKSQDKKPRSELMLNRLPA